MIVPVSVDVPMERWPIANWCLMAVTCIISLIAFPSLLGQRPIESWMLHGAGVWHSELGLLGSVMTHADPMHLAGNMVFLFVFGNAVNAKVGHAMFLSLYFLFGAAANLASMLTSDVPGLGASGAIAGVTGMFIVLYPKNTVSVFYFFWFGLRTAIGTWSIPSVVVIGLYFSKDLLFHILEQTTGFSTGVGVMAHIAGTVTGFVAAIALLLAARIRPTEAEETLLEAVGIG